MRDTRRVERLRLVAFILALITLGVLVWRISDWRGLVPAGNASTPISQEIDTTTAAPAATSTLPVVIETPEGLATSSGFETPADQWANAVLDHVLPIIERSGPPAGEVLAWWETSGSEGYLLFSDGRIMLDEEQLMFDDQRLIEFYGPGITNPDRLDPVGSISAEDTVLALEFSSDAGTQAEKRWLISDAQNSTALQAIVIQAEQRGIMLRAVYTVNPDRHIQIALVDALPIDALNAPSPSPTSILQTATTTLTPTPSLTPTPTRQPEAVMGRIVAGYINPLIVLAEQYHPGATTTFINSHPSTGALTWVDSGPLIGGRMTAINNASELVIYALQANDTEGTVVRVFEVLYSAQATRFPAEQIFFQNHRMGEVLYWLVQAAQDQNVELLVAYDDFGAKQALTIIGVRALEAVPEPSQTVTP